MTIRSYDDVIRCNSSYGGAILPLYGESQATATALTTTSNVIARAGWLPTTPSSFGSGITSFIPTMVSYASSTASSAMLVARLVDMGSLNLSTNVFTDGSAMPTRTYLGTSRPMVSSVILEVTTVLNATPGSITVTYVDQDGNTAEAGSAMALAASAPVNSVGWYILNSGDVGVRDITLMAQSGGTSPTGVVKAWGVIPISFVSCAPGGTPSAEDLLVSSFNPVRLGTSEELGVFFVGATAVARGTSGSMYVVAED